MNDSGPDHYTVPPTDPNATGCFFHSQAIVESPRVGARTRVWAFAHVLPGAVIGEDCNICDHVFVENDVRIGNRVTVKCGVQIWDGIELDDDVFVGPNATFTNDRFPRSRQWQDALPRTVVRRGASIGANATILPGLTIGRGAMVGAGAVVIHDVPNHAVVVGNPARIVSYVEADRAPLHVVSPGRIEPREGLLETGVAGVRIHLLPSFADLRGSLTVGEHPAGMPFRPERFFVVSRVPSREVRGEHAHRSLHQFLVCLCGQCSVVVDDGIRREEVLLDRTTVGLHVPPMVWATQYRFSSDAVLLVLASAPYDATEYIRDYEEYLRLVSGSR